MRTNTRVRPAEPPCSLDTFMHALGHQPAPALASIPQTLRSHIGARQFGDFGTVLMAELPASIDLSKRVERLRGYGAAAREDLPLRAHPDYTAENRRLRFAISVTTIVFSGWIIAGVIAAALAAVPDP